MTAPTDTSPAPPETAASPPSPVLLAESNGTLQTLQKMLAVMGRDERRKSDNFMYLMDQYKQLGTNLHQARKRVPPPPPRQKTPAPAGYAPTALGRARPAPTARGTAPAGTVQQAYRGQPALAHKPTGPAPTPQPGPAHLQPLPRPPQQAVPVPVTHLEPIPGRIPVAPTQPGVPTPAPRPIPMPEATGPAPQEALPLALPRFAGTLGPPGSRAIDNGPPVTNLQKLLAALGYEVAITGEYDVKTFRAVMELQKVHKLPGNGIIGLETRRLLNGMVTG